MSTVEGGSNIVTDGLILYLDTTNLKSYTNGSNVCYDLSKNLNNGTLVNGPTFNTGNPNLISFDGINDYIDCANQSNLQITIGTIGIWFKTSNAGSSFKGIITKRNAWGLFFVNNVLSAFDWGNYYASGFNINQGLRSTGINLANNQWNNICLSFTETSGNPSNNAVIYLNGVNVLTTTVRNYEQIYSLQIGGANFVGQTIGGDFNSAYVYNRVLNQQEILQNYNTLKYRFGL